MVGVSIPEVFEIWVVFFHGPKDMLLVFAVLKETRWRSPGIRARADDAKHVDLIVASFFLIHTDDPSARFINVVAVTFVENGFEHLPSA
jgi:hypothetical protein